MQFGQWNGASPSSSEGMDKMAKAITVSQAEMMRLSSRRGQAYMALPGIVAKCRTPQDLVMQQQAFFQQCARDYVTAAQAISAGWAMFMPVPSAITGLGDTINDESLNSAPETEAVRDVMSVATSGADDRASAAGGRASRQTKSNSGDGQKQAAA